MKVGCVIPVHARHLYLRSCLMQIHLQTRRPDICVVHINGPDARRYDLRCVEDLIEPWINIMYTPGPLSGTRLATTAGVKRLLELGADLFFKIDSDDIYQRKYFSQYLDKLIEMNLLNRPTGFCANLVDQYWVNGKPGGAAAIQKVRFLKGLGLRKEEIERGMQVGAPPTFAFDRPVAELLSAKYQLPKYARLRSDDAAWRLILLDHAILIDQVSTVEPVFGYLRHDGNVSTLAGNNRQS